MSEKEKLKEKSLKLDLTEAIPQQVSTAHQFILTQIGHEVALRVFTLDLLKIQTSKDLKIPEKGLEKAVLACQEIHMSTDALKRLKESVDKIYKIVEQMEKNGSK